MMNQVLSRSQIMLAFLTASACSVYIAENLLLRALPLPFIRLGLSNVIILYLLMEKRFSSALLVNILKSLIGGVFTFTLLSPATLLSLTGGLVSLGLMVFLIKWNPGFSIVGISIAGALSHNLVQIAVVRAFIIKSDTLYNLLPILLLLGLVSGIIVAYISVVFSKHLKSTITAWELA